MVGYQQTFVFRKPGKSGKADYFLFYRSTDGEWRPVSLPDGTVSDGKGETYDRCVDAICGSLESFFTSVFSAQNRRPLASYGATEIKGLLAELLKIDHLRALSTKAADVAKGLSRKLGVVQQELAAFSGKRERADETQGDRDVHGRYRGGAREAYGRAIGDCHADATARGARCQAGRERGHGGAHG